jgi:serine/threonine protein kinase
MVLLLNKLHSLLFFVLFLDKSIKSRINNRKERTNKVDYLLPTSNGCPAIPSCHWARFEQLPLKIQQGAQSAVSVLVDNFNKEPVVKKVFSSKKDFENELSALTCIRIGHNPLIVYPLCVDAMKMVMILEWAGDGDLTHWELFRNPLNQYEYDDVVRIAGQVIGAVAASHRRGILHGDIKPENFVIDMKNKTTKLIDFGLSARLGQRRIMTQGTPQTMAPEVAFPDFFDVRIFEDEDTQNQNVTYSAAKDFNLSQTFSDKPQKIQEAMDWWSVGVTIYYIFSKYFHEQQYLMNAHDVEGSESSSSNEASSSKSSRDDHYFPYKIVWAEDSDDILDFTYRPTPAGFTPDLLDLLNRLMAWNPKNRNFNRHTIKTLLKHNFFKNLDWNSIDSQL